MMLYFSKNIIREHIIKLLQQKNNHTRDTMVNLVVLKQASYISKIIGLLVKNMNLTSPSLI